MEENKEKKVNIRKMIFEVLKRWDLFLPGNYFALILNKFFNNL